MESFPRDLTLILILILLIGATAAAFVWILWKIYSGVKLKDLERNRKRRQTERHEHCDIREMTTSPHPPPPIKADYPPAPPPSMVSELTSSSSSSSWTIQTKDYGFI